MPGSFIMSGKDALCRGPANAGIFHLCPATMLFAGRRFNDIHFRHFNLYLPALN